MHRVPSRAPKAGNESAAGWRAVCFFRGNRDRPCRAWTDAIAGPVRVTPASWISGQVLDLSI